MVKKRCEYCNQEFKGVNEEQVNSQLVIHKISKHKDKVEIKEKQDGMD